MSEKEIALFTLGKALVELLGEEQAIADLTLLYSRHPEMFRNKEEVREVIDKVVSEPEFIAENPRPKSAQDYIVAKQLDENKMGEVGIRNDRGTNIVFHANKKRLKNLEILKKKIADGRDAHTPYTQAQSLDGRLVRKNISSTTDQSITESPLSRQELQRRLDINPRNYERSNSKNHNFLERANELCARAKAQNITLDSQSLNKLEGFNKNFKKGQER